MLHVSLHNAQAAGDLRASKEFTAHSLQASKEALQAWYEALPLGSQLKHIFEQDASTRRSIYHVHLLHLGGIMLCYRHIAAQEAQSPPKQENSLFDHRNQALLAAVISARIFCLLLDREELPKRCWLTM